MRERALISAAFSLKGSPVDTASLLEGETRHSPRQQDREPAAVWETGAKRPNVSRKVI